MTNTRSRFVSWLVLIVFSFVVFGASFFMITHAEHECIGESCSVCMELAECQKTLQMLGTAVAAMLILLAMLFVAVPFFRSAAKTVSAHSTLITLKVELLN